jgi:hypothetical protein
MCVIFWWGKLKNRVCLENTLMNERIILKWFVKKCDQVRVMIWCGKFLEQLISFLGEKNID